MMYLILIAGALNLFIGILVLRVGKKSRELISFAVLCLFTSVWALYNFLMFYFNEPSFLPSIYFFGAITISSLLVWSFYYTEKESQHWKQGLIYFSGLLAGSLAFIDGTVIGRVRAITSSGIDVEQGRFFSVYAFFVAICFVWAVFKVSSAYKRYSGEKRKQAIIILFGILGYGGLTTFVSVILPLFKIFDYTNLDSPSSLIFAVFTSIAIVKNKYLGKRVVVAQVLIAIMLAVSAVDITYSSNYSEFLIRGLFFVLLLGISVILVESIAKETDRKEELQFMADSLAQANEQLKKLDNAKSEFISIASHQLRTPLTAIRGFISLILEGSYGEIDPKVREALNKVYASGERLIHLVEDLLSISRIESGRMEFKFDKVQLSGIITELYDNFVLLAKNKKLYLDLKMGKRKLPQVVADKTKITEVISNLIDNAIKYTDKGGVTVKVEALLSKGYPAHYIIDDNDEHTRIKNDLTGKRVIRITVSDTGIGIPDEEMPYLFGKFSRGKDTSRLHVGGTGLGLYVGKSIMSVHKGYIWAQSDGAGKGSRFIIEIPVDGGVEISTITVDTSHETAPKAGQEKSEGARINEKKESKKKA